MLQIGHHLLVRSSTFLRSPTDQADNTNWLEKNHFYIQFLVTLQKDPIKQYSVSGMRRHVG